MHTDGLLKQVLHAKGYDAAVYCQLLLVSGILPAVARDNAPLIVCFKKQLKCELSNFSNLKASN